MVNEDQSFVATTSTSRLRLRRQRQPKKIKREWSADSNLELIDLTASTTSPTRVEPGSPLREFDHQTTVMNHCSYFISSQKFFKSKRASKVFGVYLPNGMSTSFQTRKETNRSYLLEIGLPMDLLSLNDHPIVQGYKCHLMVHGGTGSAFNVGTRCRWALFRDFCCAKRRQRVAASVSKKCGQPLSRNIAKHCPYPPPPTIRPCPK